MALARSGELFRGFDNAESALCVKINRGSRRTAIRRLFAIVGPLGDGVFWYILMLLLPVLYGPTGVLPAIQMAVTGLAGLLVYKSLKNTLVRERPFISITAVDCGTPPLDRYSFPSGHTLHAVCFSMVAVHYFPELALILLPFSILVG